MLSILCFCVMLIMFESQHTQTKEASNNIISGYRKPFDSVCLSAIKGTISVMHLSVFVWSWKLPAAKATAVEGTTLIGLQCWTWFTQVTYRSAKQAFIWANTHLSTLPVSQFQMQFLTKSWFHITSIPHRWVTLHNKAGMISWLNKHCFPLLV